jgi:hypothetical protein
MSIHPISSWACALYLLLAAAPQHSQAADIIVDVSAEFITREIDAAISEYIADNLPTFDWLDQVTHVEASASGVDETTVGIRLNLRFEATVGGVTVVVPVILDADVSLRCDSGGPFATIADLRVFPLVPIAEPIIERIRAEGNTMLLAKSRAISARLMGLLGQLPDFANIHQVCPSFDIAADGAIHAELDFVRGCINGEYRHNGCGARYHGNGKDYSCENGMWRMISYDCEPTPPPGGHPF